MRPKSRIMRTAAAAGVAGLALSALAPLTATAETADTSGHKRCPVGQQVRVHSFTGGDKVTHYWSTDTGKYGHETREIVVGSVDTQTFTLQRDVYWRVVVEGPVVALHAGAKCY